MAIQFYAQCFMNNASNDFEWHCFVVDEHNVTINGVCEGVCEVLSIKRDEYEIKMSYMPKYECGEAFRVFLKNEMSLKAYISFGDSSKRPALRVEVFKKRDSKQSSHDENNFIVEDYYFDGVRIVSGSSAVLGKKGIQNLVDNMDKGIDDIYYNDDIEGHNDFVRDDVNEEGDDVNEEGDDVNEEHDDVGDDDDEDGDDDDEVGDGVEGDDATKQVENCGKIVDFSNYDRSRNESENDKELRMIPLQSCSGSFTDGATLYIGQEFPNKNDFKLELNKIAVRASFEFCVTKSSKSIYAVRCLEMNCTWRIRAARVPNSECFSIRTYCNAHTCDLLNHNRRNRQASSNLVATKLVDNFRGGKTTPAPKTIITMMQNEGVPISYNKAWRAKQIALNQLRGDPEESFKLLPAYLYMVETMNSGTVTHLEIDSGGRFKYMFLAYGACIRGFQCMRKVIVVDGTFLKNKYKGVLLVASAQDGQHHQYPIAWAVVDSENQASWSWFFEKLKQLIPDEDDLVIISDRHQAIIHAVETVYPCAHLGHCTWHISQNIKSRIKGKAHGCVYLFMKAAGAYRMVDFDREYAELKNRCPGVAQYLESSMDISKWCRAYFPGSRYNIMTTNGVESINATLRKDRELPIISLLDSIQYLLSTWFHRRRVEASELSTILTRYAEDILRSRLLSSQKLKVDQLNEHQFNVTGEGRDSLVDLSNRTCQCRVFDIDRLPCEHVIAVHDKDKFNIYDYCSHFYTSATYALAYSETIYPVPSSEEWVVPKELCNFELKPPECKSRRGPMQKRRIPSVGEFSQQKKRRNAPPKCSLCHEQGHYKTKCPKNVA